MCIALKSTVPKVLRELVMVVVQEQEVQTLSRPQVATVTMLSAG